MLTDNEIRRIEEDSLQFKAFAQTLEEIITTSKTPITIGVYGAWGSGKTSLMRMTQELLEEQDKIKTVWFDAWKFDKTYDLRVALIHAILRRMEVDGSISPGLKDKVGKLLKRVNWLGLGKAAVSSFLPPLAMLQGTEPLLKSPEEISGKTLELIGDFDEEFKELTNEYVGDEGRMVVFIDDLDRCISEKTIDILEAIKLFLNVPLSVFVIGADKARIEDGIIEKFGEKSKGWAGNYLEKIVQIPFTLPPLRKEVITKRFIQGLDISTEIKEYADILVEVGDNPRRIKRLLNSFELKRILARNEKLKVEENMMAKFAVIEFRWHDFYTDLIGIYNSATKENLAKILKDIKTNEAEREEKLNEWENLKKYLDDKKLMDFLEEEPSLMNDNLDLDGYVYLAKSTVELPISALKDMKDDVRRRAAETLGMIGDAKAVEPLIETLWDRHEPVRFAAEEALRKIGARAVEPLIGVLKVGDTLVRASAVRTLGNIGSTKELTETLKKKAIEALTVAAEIERNSLLQSIIKDALKKLNN